jgi:hypothetical protein
LADVLDPARGRLRALVERLRQGPLSPLVAAQFEKDLQQLTRELGRVVAQWAFVGDGGSAVRGGQKSWAWARKMQKLLLKPGGAGRVLHSAAALRARLKPRGKRPAEVRRAYKYLQARRQHLRYAEYRRLGLPLGSGVTEAACKTVLHNTKDGVSDAVMEAACGLHNVRDERRERRPKT